jgi:hypothetical protein
MNARQLSICDVNTNTYKFVAQVDTSALHFNKRKDVSSATPEAGSIDCPSSILFADRIPWVQPPPICAPPCGRGKWVHFVETTLEHVDSPFNGCTVMLDRGVNFRDRERTRRGPFFDRVHRRQLWFKNLDSVPGLVGDAKFGRPVPFYYFVTIPAHKKPPALTHQSTWMYNTLQPAPGDIGQKLSTPLQSDIPRVTNAPLPHHDDLDDGESPNFPPVQFNHPAIILPSFTSSSIVFDDEHTIVEEATKEPPMLLPPNLSEVEAPASPSPNLDSSQVTPRIPPAQSAILPIISFTELSREPFSSRFLVLSGMRLGATADDVTDLCRQLDRPDASLSSCNIFIRACAALPVMSVDASAAFVVECESEKDAQLIRSFLNGDAHVVRAHFAPTALVQTIMSQAHEHPPSATSPHPVSLSSSFSSAGRASRLGQQDPPSAAISYPVSLPSSSSSAGRASRLGQQGPLHYHPYRRLLVASDGSADEGTCSAQRRERTQGSTIATGIEHDISARLRIAKRGRLHGQNRRVLEADVQVALASAPSQVFTISTHHMKALGSLVDHFRGLDPTHPTSCSIS